VSEPTGWQRLVQRLASLRPMSWVLARTLHIVDRPLLKWSKGRASLTSAVTGLPIAMLTTVGAKSGRKRTTPLVALMDGATVVLVASFFGNRHHPAWYYNLRAHPEAMVEFGGREDVYVAREAAPEERAAYWQRALGLYAGYAAYEARAAGRKIPIWVLTNKTTG